MMKRIGNTLYAIVGLVVGIITTALWALSNTVRVWVRDHSNWLRLVLMATISAVMVLVIYAIDLNRENIALKTEGSKLASNDTAMLHEILAQVPRHGAMMSWLKSEFFVKAIQLKFRLDDCFEYDLRGWEI
jgi:hypothetical protein